MASRGRQLRVPRGPGGALGGGTRRPAGGAPHPWGLQSARRAFGFPADSPVSQFDSLV